MHALKPKVWAPKWWRANAYLALALACVIAIQLSGLLRPADDALGAMRARMLDRAASGSVVIVEIDPRSLETVGEWPWSRERYARVVENLHAAGAKFVGFDIDFSARSPLIEDDRAFAAAIANADGSVVLPTFMQRDGFYRNLPDAQLSRDALIASVNVPIDADGRVRNYYRGFQSGDSYQPSLATLLSGQGYGSTAPFLLDYGISLPSIDRLSFIDVYRDNFDPERVRGRSVLIGATALELGDEFATPIKPAVPGVYLHALAYESLLQNRALTRLGGLGALLFALIVLVAIWPRRRGKPRTRVMLHVAAAAVALCGPLAVQALLPLSIDISIVFVAQAIAIFTALQAELSYRASELARQREEGLRTAALQDPETHLPNRRAMLEALAARLASAQNVAAVAIGIERFPAMRAAVGYANANSVMRLISDRMQEAGFGQTFHISTSVLGLIIEGDAECIETGIERLRDLELSVHLAGHDLDALSRLGVSSFDDRGISGEKLLEEAAIALDLARAKHRRVVVFSADAFDRRREISLLADIGKSLREGHFWLAYQPKASLRDGKIIGAEALMRWQHPEYGPIAPDRFIAIAEDTGAIDDLTRFALTAAIEDQAFLREQGVALRLSVNISGRSLCDSDFCRFAIQAVTAAEADLCFEITETAVIDDPAVAVEAIQMFRRAGIHISIDDYGSGLSSLGYLKTIAADELKLDRSLVQDVTASVTDRLIVKSTLDLAHSLGMLVVAEGVEDEATRAILAGLGCDSVQGYVFSKPLSLPALFAFHTERMSNAHRAHCEETGLGAARREVAI